MASEVIDTMVQIDSDCVVLQVCFTDQVEDDLRYETSESACLATLVR